MEQPKPLTKQEFDNNRFAGRGASALHDEKEFFQLGPILGINIQDRVDSDWSFVVMAKEGADPLFRAVDYEVSISGQDLCRTLLFERMHKYVAKKVVS